MRIYYINLEHREDRRVHINKVLDELGFEENNITRVTGHYVPDNGALGCALSHIEVIKNFIRSKDKSCIILEDDFMYYDIDNFNKQLERLYESDLEWNLIQLSSNTIKCEPTKYKFLNKIIESQTTSGYMLNIDSATKLLECFVESSKYLKDGSKHEWHIDQNWKKLQIDNLWYCFEPKLGYQIDGWSDIEKKNVTYRC